MKNLLAIIGALAISYTAVAQSANLVVKPGASWVDYSQTLIKGSLQNEGQVINENEIVLDENFNSPGSYSGSGSVTMQSLASTQIDCADTLDMLIIDKAGSELLLAQDLFTRTGLELAAGKLNQNGNTCHVGSPQANAVIIGGDISNYMFGGPVKMHFDSPTLLHMPIGETSGSLVDLSVYQVDPGSHWLSIEAKDGAHPQMPLSDHYLNMHWDINHSGPTGLEFDMTVAYDNSLSVGSPESFTPNAFENPSWVGAIGTGADSEEGVLLNDWLSDIMNWSAVSVLEDMALFSWDAGCVGDLNNDGAIDTSDLLTLLSGFGCSVDCTSDLTGDGAVDTSDLLLMLSVFGSLCP